MPRYIGRLYHSNKLELSMAANTDKSYLPFQFIFNFTLIQYKRELFGKKINIEKH